jgi:hypothetical protein
MTIPRAIAIAALAYVAAFTAIWCQAGVVS